jgi:hypothetical protein
MDRLLMRRVIRRTGLLEHELLPWITAVILVSVFFISLFIQYSLRGYEWWADELFSLWASDNAMSFFQALRHRILPDSNPPLYYITLYWTRMFIHRDGVAVFIMNFVAVMLAGYAVLKAAFKAKFGWVGVVAVSAFVLSGPIQYYMLEGRSYLVALCVVFVASFYAGLSIIFPGQVPIRRMVIYGVLASLTHVYAALFCCGLAAGLLVVSLVFRRDDLIRIGLSLGLSTSVLLLAWLPFAIRSIHNLDWLPPFTASEAIQVFGDTLIFTFGSYFQLVFVLVLYTVGLSVSQTRQIFVANVIALFAFLVVPMTFSYYLHSIILPRYWMIGGASIPPLIGFMVKYWSDNNSEMSRLALICSLIFIAGSAVQTIYSLPHLKAMRLSWDGADVVGPALRDCPGGVVHVATEVISDRKETWPPRMWGFAYLTAQPLSRFQDAGLESTPMVSLADTPCNVLGWAEHSWGWENLNDSDLLKFLKIDALPENVKIVRHNGGFVIEKLNPGSAIR